MSWGLPCWALSMDVLAGFPRCHSPMSQGWGRKWDKIVANGRNVVIMTSGQRGLSRASHTPYGGHQQGRPGISQEPVQILARLNIQLF